MKYFYRILKIIISKLNKFPIINSNYSIKIISVLIRPKFIRKDMLLIEKSKFPQLYISRIRRLYYYTGGISQRIDTLLREYLVKDFEFNFGPDDYLVDIGSNIGEFTIGFVNGHNIKNIIAIEPDPTEFEVLKKNLLSLKDFCEIQAYNIALTDISSNNIRFYLNNDSGDSSIDNISNDFIDVKTKTLDQVLAKYDKIGIIKLEAEGHEPKILQGCKKSFDKIKYFTVDVGPELGGNSTFEEVNEILTNNGFKLIKKGTIRETALYKNINL